MIIDDVAKLDLTSSATRAVLEASQKHPPGLNMTSTATIDKIARRHLGIETLAVRNSDSLDFHDVGVVGVSAALQAAFEAGQKAPAQRKPMTASRDYAQTLQSVQAKLEQLTRAVEAHAARQGRDPHNWGFISDIGALELTLTEALERVGS